ncbi:hypothetical protein [Saccharothrix lopnurensis]|uniref:HTH cro/C1-type domain-containing protein n=1 Tax=Saccharothrix lopnurensis TaxID=1670621 RepID=A0ABW1P966_9PSEU
MFTSSDLRRRCRCTGETPNAVRRQRTTDGQALVPRATTPGQARVEAEFLQAAVRAMAGLRRRGHPLRPTSLINRVQLGSHAVGLQVDDTALDDLLAEVLPTTAGGRVRGVPGLRAHPGRDHLDLRAPDGELRLLGVTRKRWRRAAAGLAESVEPAEPAGLTGLAESAGATGPAEPAGLAPVPPPPTPAGLMSGVLRRLPLWRGAAWLDGVVVGDVLELHWRGGPPSRSVAAILTRSACGIAGAAAVAHEFRDAVRGVALTTAHRRSTTTTGEPDRAWVEWLAATAPGPAVRERAVRPVRARPDLPDLWEQHEMRAALASRDITTAYRLLIGHGVPARRIAELTDRPAREVHRVLDGGRVEDYDTLAAIAHGLGIPPGYMGLAHHERPVTSEPCGCSHLDERARRDQFLTHAALVTVGSAVSWPCRATTCCRTA